MRGQIFRRGSLSFTSTLLTTHENTMHSQKRAAMSAFLPNYEDVEPNTNPSIKTPISSVVFSCPFFLAFQRKSDCLCTLHHKTGNRCLTPFAVPLNSIVHSILFVPITWPFSFLPHYLGKTNRGDSAFVERETKTSNLTSGAKTAEPTPGRRPHSRNEKRKSVIEQPSSRLYSAGRLKPWYPLAILCLDLRRF